jgi:glycosidase
MIRSRLRSLFLASVWGLCALGLLTQAQAAGKATRAERAAQAANLEQVRARWPEDEVIYFVLPDRFENGDPGNDRGGLSGDRLVTGFDPTHVAFYHGGDFRGLLRRLDYIQGMGVTAIWFTPIFKNQPVQGLPGHEGSGFHGYWILDFTTVDPHLGTEDDFRALVDAAHARGMKVIMDIVANHTADVIQYRECPPQGECPYRSRAEYPDHAYTPYIPAGLEHAKKPEWLNDPQWYHNRGNSTFQGENSLMGDFFGLDDIKTEEPRVVEGFIDIYGSWIDRFGIDGFRIDTAKHVNPEFWQAFVPAMLKRARAKGINHFHIFGEVANDEFDPVPLARATRVARLPSVLDFDFPVAVRQALTSGRTDTLASMLDADVLFMGGEDAARKLPTFLGNHDQGRLGWRLKQLHPDYTDDQLLARERLGNALLLTLRGVPVIYYGDEQGFTGYGDDNAAREDMFVSQVPAYRQLSRLGGSRGPDKDSFDTSHPLYRLIGDLARVRQAEPALRRGRSVVREASREAGLFAVSRFDPASGREVLLVFNTSTKPLSQPVLVESSSRHFHSLMGNCQATVSAPGSYAVQLEPLSWAICAAD